MSGIPSWFPGIPSARWRRPSSPSQRVRPSSAPNASIFGIVNIQGYAYVPPDKMGFLRLAIDLAGASHLKWGDPVSIKISQAILESGWGRHHMGAANNYFGIKGVGPAGSASRETFEYVNGVRVIRIEKFRAYNSIEESFDDHGKLVGRSARYAAARSKLPDKRAYAMELGQIYATDPSYGRLLLGLVDLYGLERYDGA